jgi:hypothetical protein
VYSTNATAPTTAYTTTESFSAGTLANVEMSNAKYNLSFSADIANDETDIWIEDYEFSTSFYMPAPPEIMLDGESTEEGDRLN